MPTIRVRPQEDPESAIRRFKRLCEKAGILTELRSREAFEKPTTRRKRAKAAARKRLLKKIARERPVNPFARRGNKTSAKRVSSKKDK